MLTMLKSKREGDKGSRGRGGRRELLPAVLENRYSAKKTTSCYRSHTNHRIRNGYLLLNGLWKFPKG